MFVPGKLVIFSSLLVVVGSFTLATATGLLNANQASSYGGSFVGCTYMLPLEYRWVVRFLVANQLVLRPREVSVGLARRWGKGSSGAERGACRGILLHFGPEVYWRRRCSFAQEVILRDHSTVAIINSETIRAHATQDVFKYSTWIVVMLDAAMLWHAQQEINPVQKVPRRNLCRFEHLEPGTCCKLGLLLPCLKKCSNRLHIYNDNFFYSGQRRFRKYIPWCAG